MFNLKQEVMITETMTNQEILRELEKMYPELLSKVEYYANKYYQRSSICSKIQDAISYGTVKCFFKFDYKFKDNAFVIVGFYHPAFGVPSAVALLKLWKCDGYHYYFVSDRIDTDHGLIEYSKARMNKDILDFDSRPIERFIESTKDRRHGLVEICPHFIDRFIERMGSEKIDVIKKEFETDIIGVIFYGCILSQDMSRSKTVGQILEMFSELDPKGFSEFSTEFNRLFKKEESIYRKRKSTICRFLDGAAILNWIDDFNVTYTTFIDENRIKDSQNEYIDASLGFSYGLLQGFAERKI